MSQQSQSESKRCKSTTDIVDGIVPNNNDDDFLEAFRTHPTTRQLEQEQVLQNESKSPISLANPMSPFPHQSLSSNDNGDPDYIVDDNERDVLEESPMQPPPLPFCSVLNTVVDYCMMPPTSLFELQEFRQQQNDLIGSSVSRIQVPVLRIFGPIVRRLWKDNDTVHGTGNEKVTTPPRSLGTVQSACLYIHGAYPYVLARPVAAGPDGTGHDQCPWDTAASVQRMIAVLTETMETVLQETNASFLEPSSNSTAAPLRIIRQINVVTGRGFYTYCPGPAAPFLRVEYYNPSDRWKVKRCLEHGLSDLPVSTYFPLQRHPSAPAADDDLILKFHCYEAHIPFTMQFFKDWNLAGLSYIHIASNNTATFSNTNSESISGARFRTPLPNLIRSSVTTWHHQPSTLRHGHDKNNGETVAAEQRTRLAFLASNTPSEYLSGKCGHDSWMQSFSNAHRPINHSAVGPTNLKSSTTTDSTSQTETNLQKRTSCDVELDIHVSSILNVLEVMTDLPDEWEAKQQIHWRAVPSLKEIWSQERRRMAKLLRPQHNFLSDSEKSDQAPPFTLNVKKDASLSGAVLARQGMERLVNVTDGLEINFRRVMKQIVERHEAILESDDVLKKRKMAHLQRNSVPSCNPLSPVIDNDKFSDGQNLTPSYDETMEALHSLGNIRQGSSSTPNDSEYCNVDRRNYFSTSQNCSPTPTPTQSSKLLNDQLLLSLSQACASQSFANSTTLDSLRDEFRLSQRVERGDGIVDCHFECMDEVIDPETLVPFETFDDEEEEDNDSFGESCEVDESRIEQILSSLATQSYMSTTKPLENNNLLLDEDSSVDSFTLLSGTRNKEILFDPEECNDRHSPGATASPQISAREENRHEHVSEPQTDYFHWDHHPNVFIECRTPPPTRGDAIELTRGTGLLPMQLQGHPPPWANFLSEYEATRNEMRPRTWFPFIGTKGVDVLPVITAPAQKEVVNWIKRNSRRRHPVDEIENNIQKSHFLNSKKARKAPSESKIDIVQIEHVDWNLSQESSVSTMTKSLNDTVDGISQSSTTLGFQATGLLNEHNQSGSIEPTVTFSTPFDSSTQDSALQGMGNQGGRLLVEGGGHLKTKHTQSNIPAAVLSIDSMDSFPCPVSIMSIEVYVQCRTGRAGVNDSKTIALTPSSDRDKVCSIVYVLCRDPGGGVPFEFLERGCIFTPLERELEQTTHGLSFCCQQLVSNIRKSMPPRSFGVNSPLTIECVRDERQLLLRFASIVRLKDPDMLLSWDTQGAGLGFVIERGMAVGKNAGEIQSPSAKIDMARLLGRTPTVSSRSPGPGDQAFDSADAGSEALEEMSRSVANKERKVQESSPTWKGSGLGTEWDERVGAGAAAASIVSIATENRDGLLVC